jgi:hypothetical protein
MGFRETSIGLGVTSHELRATPDGHEGASAGLRGFTAAPTTAASDPSMLRNWLPYRVAVLLEVPWGRLKTPGRTRPMRG